MLGGQALHGDDALGLQLEQRLVRGELDVVAALGAGTAQARALAASKEQDSQLALCSGQ